MLELGENGLEGRCLSPTLGLCVKSAVESDMKLGINILSVLFSFSSVFDSMGVLPFAHRASSKCPIQFGVTETCYTYNLQV